MRYAIKAAPAMTTYGAVREVFRAADGIDLYESAWVFDHLEPILSQPRSGPCLEGWTTLAALAEATTRIRIGTMVTGVPYRHPAVLVKMAATVDVLSGGRLELGIGAGWNQPEFDAYGMELAPLGERFDRFDEACEVIRALLGPTPVTRPSPFFPLADAYCEPKPIQAGGPPIWIGGAGPKRTLRAVARYADYWNAPFSFGPGFADTLEILAAHCADIGRDPAEIVTTAQTPYDPTGGPSAMVDHCAALDEAGCQLVVIYLPESNHDAATVEAVADALRG